MAIQKAVGGTMYLRLKKLKNINKRAEHESTSKIRGATVFTVNKTKSSHPLHDR